MIAPSSPPDEGFVCFAEWLRLSPAETERLHAALVACGDRQAKSVLFGLQRFASRRSQSGMMRDLTRFSLGVGHPRNLVRLIEALTARGLLSRLEASALEEKLFARMRAQDGMWR